MRVVRRQTVNREKIPSIEINSLMIHFIYQRRETFEVGNIGGKHVPVVIADLSKIEKISHKHLQSVGYTYDEATDKWNISDAAADYIFTGKSIT